MKHILAPFLVFQRVGQKLTDKFIHFIMRTLGWSKAQAFSTVAITYALLLLQVTYMRHSTDDTGIIVTQVVITILFCSFAYVYLRRGTKEENNDSDEGTILYRTDQRYPPNNVLLCLFKFDGVCTFLNHVALLVGVVSIERTFLLMEADKSLPENVQYFGWLIVCVKAVFQLLFVFGFATPRTPPPKKEKAPALVEVPQGA